MARKHQRSSQRRSGHCRVSADDARHVTACRTSCATGFGDHGTRGDARLPHSLGPGETAWIELELGVIERGAEIEIATTAGQSLGVISPFGIRSGDPTGTYTVPLPGDAILDGRVSLRLTLDRNGHAQRAPTAREVKSVKIMPAARSIVDRPPSRRSRAKQPGPAGTAARLERL